MSKWEMVKFGDVFKIASGGTPSKSKPEYYENGTIQWVRTGDLKDKYITQVDNWITEEALRNSSAKLFPIDTVLIAMYGATIGACSILSIEAATNQACAAFLPNKDVDSSYLYFFLCSKKDDFIKLGVGGAQPNISATILKDVNIPLPPLETQKQISKTLDTAAELLAMRKQQLAELDSLIKSTFYDMFGELKNIETNALIDLINEGAGLSYGIIQPGDDVGNGVGIIRPVDMVQGTLVLENIKYVPSEIEAPYKKTRLIGNEILISVRGTVGASVLTDERCKDMNVVRNIAVIRQNDKVVNKVYLNEYLKSESSQRYIQENTKGATLKGVNLSALGELRIPLPPLYLQNQFATIVTKIEEQKSLVKQAIDETQHLFDSLMSEYFE
ncbi:restriction modification system S chain-like protein [Paenibacillus marchantiophytorum]|uniref:Restriction modification system S chain-like protein n=1 Tax=Paenibacillus marchantiophytorum TaxID=1619310 RepID=A0ABQ1EZ29_9BACL|nr:restriction endonuclease subunit S [Paenibacillus marchantiophytorum]GFZ94004.1 restriction modification system S chain-like protein [Paenibacillus marchantiophytorum]